MNTLLAFGIFSSVLSYIPWSAIFILTRLVGLRLYIIRRQEDITRIQKRIGDRFSQIGDRGKGIGYAIGLWYILHISADLEHGWMITTVQTYTKLTKETSISLPTLPSKTPQYINIIERVGSYASCWFNQRKIQIELDPRPEQSTIISKIVEHIREHKQTVVYIWGEPGKGKSMIGLLLARQLNATYCNTLKVWQPNDRIDALYSELDPTEVSPIVLVFDEIDSILTDIHMGTIQEHKHFPTTVRNKAGWNNFLDHIQRGIYPHLVLVLTTNKSPDFIRDMDPSYIRDGRVNIIAELK